MNSRLFAEFKRQVSEEMERQYGITWADASGDDELLISALQNDETPEFFVRWFGMKYDLIPKDSW